MSDLELKACPYCGSGDEVRMWSSPGAPCARAQSRFDW